MRPVWVIAAFLGCGGTAEVPRSAPPGPPGPTTSAQLAEDEAYRPSYGAAELQQTLIAERGAEATGERLVAELEARELDAGVAERLRVAVADLRVRRNFIASLEACETAGTTCPPRLDEPAWSYDQDPEGPLEPPPLDAALRFDLTSWRQLAVELHGRACACRTMACVDSVGFVIDSLEARPASEVQGDEIASTSITRARECLFRLRGRKPTPGARHRAAEDGR